MKKNPKNGVFGHAFLSGDPLFLKRERINYLFDKALEKPVVFVSAGEGYGKTQAVHSYLHQRKKAAIWIPMSERDNVPLHFWENVTRAVSIRDPQTAKALEETGFPETNSEIARCISVISSNRAKKKKQIVVIDDCHLITEESILNFVNRLLSSPFPGETIIIISRTEPNFNSIALLSKGSMSRIDSGDLRFNEEEIAKYFQLVNIKLKKEEINEIFAGTEGWVLSLSLIASELKSGAGKYSSSLLESGSLRTMVEKLFYSVSASLGSFLVKLSLFEQWPLDLVEKLAASGKEKLPAMDELTENMKYISSLLSYDSYLHGFRIHRVFLNYLKEKQGSLREDEIKTAGKIAADWYMKNHLYIYAAINYEMAGDIAGLLNSIYSFPRLLDRSAATSFLKIISWFLSKDLSKNEGKEILLLAYVTRAGMLLNLGRFKESRIVLDEGIKKFKTMPLNQDSAMLLSLCYNTLGSLSIVSYRETGNVKMTVKYFKTGHEYYRLYPYKATGPGTKTSVGSYVIPIGNPPKPGEFEEFIRITALCVPYASESAGGFLYGMDSLCRAEFAFFTGDLNTAEQYAMEAVLKAREKEQYETESRGLFYLLRVYLCQGNVSASHVIWERMEAQLKIQDYVNRYVIYDIITGWFYSHTGETQLIAPWLKNDFEESSLNLIYHNFETMVKAKSFYAGENPQEALKFLDQKNVIDGLGSFFFGLLEMTALKAVVHNKLGNEKAAIKALETAYKLSASYSANSISTFDMPFMELGDDMRELTSAVLSGGKSHIPCQWLELIRNKSSVYAKKLASVSEYYYKKTEDRIPFFSPRELSILSSLSMGLTRQEIAAEYSLSGNKVKSIIKTIYEKLGTAKSADAIRIATRTGILSSQQSVRGKPKA